LVGGERREPQHTKPILRCINGLLTPERGEVVVGNTSVHALRTEAERIFINAPRN
jgi:ABC-type methionine transport system ATPase subunit